MIHVVGDFEPATSAPNVNNDRIFEPEPADVDDFGIFAGPLNLKFDSAGNLITGGDPAVGLQHTRVLEGAGASLPPDFFTRHTPEIMTRNEARHRDRVW